MKSRQNQITIATANTHWTRALEYQDGLKPIANADIILLQEVIQTRTGCEALLTKSGFELVHMASRFGLVMAKRIDSDVTLIPASIREHRLQKMGIIEHYLTQKSAKRPHQFTEHGMIAAKFGLNNSPITVANVHLSIPLKPLARNLQVRTMEQELTRPYYQGLLVVGGDMNHYRGPKTIDKSMHLNVNLCPIDLSDQPTWYVRGSKQEKYLKVAAFFRQKPIEYYDGYHDTFLYRKESLYPISASAVAIESDHRAIVTRFRLKIRNPRRTTARTLQ